jgi:beta-glucosidase
MPWRDRVKAIVEAWYSGQVGALPTAEALTGRVNPSGRLPITVLLAEDAVPERLLERASMEPLGEPGGPRVGAGDRRGEHEVPRRVQHGG